MVLIKEVDYFPIPKILVLPVIAFMIRSCLRIRSKFILWSAISLMCCVFIFKPWEDASQNILDEKMVKKGKFDDESGGRLYGVSPKMSQISRGAIIVRNQGKAMADESSRIRTILSSGTDTLDETTPGTSLIALRNGYMRDDQQLTAVRDKAFTLARDPNPSLATRVTALSIAGESDGREVKIFAENLVKAQDTPLILRKVAERIVR